MVRHGDPGNQFKARLGLRELHRFVQKSCIFDQNRLSPIGYVGQEDGLARLEMASNSSHVRRDSFRGRWWQSQSAELSNSCNAALVESKLAVGNSSSNKFPALVPALINANRTTKYFSMITPPLDPFTIDQDHSSTLSHHHDRTNTQIKITFASIQNSDCSHLP